MRCRKAFNQLRRIKRTLVLSSSVVWKKAEAIKFRAGGTKLLHMGK